MSRRAAGGGRALFGWWSGPLAGLVTSLVASVPTMIVAENWHGRPLIDEDGLWWLVPAAIAVVAFFVGGMVAGRGRRTTASRLTAGLIVAVSTVAALLAADGVRRLLVNPTLSRGVVAYWAVAGVITVVVTVLGAFATAGGRRSDK